MGLIGVSVPERWGGAGLDYVSLALALEEIAAGDGATSTIIERPELGRVRHRSTVTAPTRRRSASSSRWRAARSSGCFCLTEPHVGSDAAAIRTTRASATARLGAERREAVHHHRARTPTSPWCSRSATRARARRASARSSCRPTRPATSSRASRTSSASTPPTRRRSCSRTAACPAANLLGARGRGLSHRAVQPGGRAHRHRRPGGGHGARRLRGGARSTRTSARASASRSSSTRR